MFRPSSFCLRCLSTGLLVAGTALAAIAEEPFRPSDVYQQEVVPLLREYCVRCHGPQEAAAELRVDQLQNNFSGKPQVEAWQAVLERVALELMPPEDEPRPAAANVRRVVQWIDRSLREAGHESTIVQELLMPEKGNVVDHRSLFDRPPAGHAAGPARLWRLSPFGYRGFIDGLTDGMVTPETGPRRPAIPAPFGLVNEPGFRDYSIRYAVGASEAEQLAKNARLTIEYLLAERRGGQILAPPAVAAIDRHTGSPTQAEIDAAVVAMFRKVLLRSPKEDEQHRYAEFLTRNLANLGNHEGLIRGLAPLFLHPEGVFRLELLAGPADEHGRRLLAPLSLAHAIAYALTDNPPDDLLLAAATDGRLASGEDVRREVRRILDDPQIEKPRILRFFQEYFGYPEAVNIFKDAHIIKAADVGDFRAPVIERMVHDTDQLVLHVLEKDRHVLRELLTIRKTYISYDHARDWNRIRRKKGQRKDGKSAKHPFNNSFKLNGFYNFPADQWTPDGAMELPPQQRSGILTQPAWLIAFSTNTDNHAILRGKWVRDRLLGGHLPDTPVNVDAQLPEEPDQTLRHRMRVTREQYCWQCHRMMDPLGLPFEMYDHFGRYRTMELDQPVDASGEIAGTGSPQLDGPVEGAVQMLHRLAKSERVEQVFVRHAFRYWMGRNEMMSDSPTLMAMDKAYTDGGGSFKAMVIELLCSDSFLYRK